MLKLTIELVPRSSWFTNLRSELSKDQWDTLRRSAYRKANYVCEICGGRGDKWPVECHERWYYDDKNKVQKLSGLIALCPDCHQVKHIGLAQINGKLEQAIKHLASVNKMSNTGVENYIEKCWDVWEERNQHEWQLDLTWLDTVEANPPKRKGHNYYV